MSLRFAVLLYPALFLIAGAFPSLGGTDPQAAAFASLNGESCSLRNNYPVPLCGPFEARTSAGFSGAFSSGDSHVTGDGTMLSGFVCAGPQDSISLASAKNFGPAENFVVKASPTGEIEFRNGSRSLLTVSFQLLQGPPTIAAGDPAAWSRTPIDWHPVGGKANTLVGLAGEYALDLFFSPSSHDGIQWILVDGSIRRVQGSKQKGCLALLREIRTSQVQEEEMRWNGLSLPVISDSPPADFDQLRVQGTDWVRWRDRNGGVAWTNLFVPGLSAAIKPAGPWASGTNYFLQEHAVQKGSLIQLTTVLAGPGPENPTGNLPETPYALPMPGESMQLHWRVAIGAKIDAAWMRREAILATAPVLVTQMGKEQSVNLGVGGVSLGEAYFPYSTDVENFDLFRIKGDDRDGWWPFSPALWSHWRELKPQMQADLRCIRAAGFDQVRLHHLELLTEMNRPEAFAFLDFYMAECKEIGLGVLMDSSGPDDWLTALAQRYGRQLTGFQVNNEALIPGHTQAEFETLRSQYLALKKACPGLATFTANGMNPSALDEAIALGLPMDRTCIHYYEYPGSTELHPERMEALGNAGRATACYANRTGLAPIMTEFNWKYITRETAEQRALTVGRMWTSLLQTRSFPDLFQFQWKETLAVNQRTARLAVRHYEPVSLDGRPKPELLAFMEASLPFLPADHPNRVIAGDIETFRFDAKGKVTHLWTFTNRSSQPLLLHLTPETFSPVDFRSEGKSDLTLQAGETARIPVAASIDPNELPGLYRVFLRVDYPGGRRYLWGQIEKRGNPDFSQQSLMPGKVVYRENPAAVTKLDFTQDDVAVIFGSSADKLDVEMSVALAETLQSATGRPVRRLREADFHDTGFQGICFLVGTPAELGLLSTAGINPAGIDPAKGLIAVSSSGNKMIVALTGLTPAAVQSATVDLIMRYWPQAKDSTMRVIGFEKGTGLGHPIAAGFRNTP